MSQFIDTFNGKGIWDLTWNIASQGGALSLKLNISKNGAYWSQKTLQVVRKG